MSDAEIVEDAIARYPIPAPVDYPDSAAYAMQVVFVQGRRQGWIDARTDERTDREDGSA